MIAATTTGGGVGVGALAGLGLLGALALYNAMNPPKAIPIPTTCDDDIPRDNETSAPCVVRSTPELPESCQL